jgi:hypothetical protein
MLAEALRSVILYYISLQTPLKVYILSYDLRLRQLYNHINRYWHFTLRLMLINILINTNTASTRPTERIEDVNKAKDKALAYTEKIVQEIHTIKRDTREAKKIKYSNRRSAMFMTNQAVD